MRILLVGDVVGRPGRRAVSALLPQVVEETGASFVVANGENSAGGFGLTRATVDELLSCGIDVITTGNHVWDRREFVPAIAELPRVLRPANFPDGAPGAGSLVVESRDGVAVGVVNLMGRTFMAPLDCPFRAADRILDAMRARTAVIVVDFHAEATAEKVAMGWFLDGRVSVVFGTHTHVPTADERVLPGGTAYLTDLGMTGPLDGIIGMDRQGVLAHLLSGLPHRYEVAPGRARMDMAVVDIDPATGRAHAITRFSRLTES